VIVHLIDGTYELFRHFYGLRRFNKGVDRPYGAVVGVLQTVLQALGAMGIVVWPMIELEADDALASAAHLASGNENVQKVAIWTPDKDLAQCLRDTRVVQIDGRRKTIRDAPGVREKFGVDPPLIPDLLALVGDAADGYPVLHIPEILVARDGAAAEPAIFNRPEQSLLFAGLHSCFHQISHGVLALSWHRRSLANRRLRGRRRSQ
jgi:hypothetical protein